MFDMEEEDVEAMLLCPSSACLSWKPLIFHPRLPICTDESFSKQGQTRSALRCLSRSLSTALGKGLHLLFAITIDLSASLKARGLSLGKDLRVFSHAS